MKVLSWDVGIINLAYCLLDIKKEKIKINDKDEEKITYQIYEWGLIDLSKKKEYHCQVCQKNASLKYIDIEDEERKELSERIIQLKKENEQLRNQLAVAELAVPLVSMDRISDLPRQTPDLLAVRPSL